MNFTSAETVVVLAPHGRDAAIAAGMLGEAGMSATIAPDLSALVAQLRNGAGFALVTEEALRSADLRALDAFLKDQAEWSDFPFILLTQRGGGLERNPAAARFLETLGNVTFLERPFHPTTLVSLAKAALRARLRQYEARSRLEAIHASEAQFRTFAQAMPNHVWTAPPDGQLDWFNERTYQYSGRSHADLAGNRWAEIVHPDDLAAAASRWAASIASGDIYDTEFRIRRTDGAYRWHLVRAVPIRAADGTLLRWIGTNTDIDAQKAAEVASTRDRDRLWLLSQEIMMVCDFAGVVTAVNPSVTRLLGWDEVEVVGHNIADFVHPEDIGATAAEVARLSGGATTLAFENRYRTRAGGYRLLEWTAVPDGRRIHAVGRDITDERILARDRERIWNLSPVLKLVAGADGMIQAVNPSWTQTLGWTNAETVGRNILDFIAPDGRSAGVDTLRMLRNGQKTQTEREYVAKGGERRRLQWIVVPEDETIYAFGRDVTSEREAAEALAATEDALRQSQKMEAVGQLTGGIAHDFNNLLQGITGSLEIVQRRMAEGRAADADRFITGAVNSANRAAALTHRLLAFSRRQPLDPKPVQANPLIRSMEDLLSRTVGERIALNLALAEGLWWTRCDANQLENAILNLVINARDAMPEGGTLTIATENVGGGDVLPTGLAPGDYVCVSVADTGVGMDAATIERAFEPFFTTKPLGQGTGLGLSMIYGFARQSEGDAAIESRPGEGTRFRLFLPRHAAGVAAAVSPTTSETRRARDGDVVLVVEDEPIVRGLVIEVLSGLGYQTIEAADGPEGVALLQSDQRIDLLVTDIGLPGLDGRQVADAGRAARPGLRTLFMTGYAENAALASGFLEEGMALITKPFAMDALAERTDALMRG